MNNNNRRISRAQFAKRLDSFREASADYEKIKYKDIAVAVGYGERGGEQVSDMFSGNRQPFWTKTLLLIQFLKEHIPNFSVDSLFRNTSVADEHSLRQRSHSVEKQNREVLTNRVGHKVIDCLMATESFKEFLMVYEDFITNNFCMTYKREHCLSLLDKACQQVIRQVRLAKGNYDYSDLPLIE